MLARRGTGCRGSRAGLLLLLMGAACAPEGSPQAPSGALAGDFDRIDAAAAAIDSIFKPLPLLTPAQEEALRAHSNAEQLQRARALGIERGLATDTRLVPLRDSRYWKVGELDHSQPLVVPATVELLTEIGRRFHERLARLGAPPFRMEISSVLRTSADQEALRRVNPNAARGESTHEYGTTVDVLHSAFAAPIDPIVDLSEPLAQRYATLAAERVGARRALELKAVLGEVLLQMQREGRVMVTLERQQPVFHMTLARSSTP